MKSAKICREKTKAWAFVFCAEKQGAMVVFPRTHAGELMVFGPLKFCRKTQGHILTGITSGGSNSFSPSPFFYFFLSWQKKSLPMLFPSKCVLGFFCKKKSSPPQKKKKSHPTCYSRQNVSFCFFCRISAKTPSGHHNHEFSSVGPWERRNSFLAATFSFPAKLMKISFP